MISPTSYSAPDLIIKNKTKTGAIRVKKEESQIVQEVPGQQADQVVKVAFISALAL